MEAKIDKAEMRYKTNPCSTVGNFRKSSHKSWQNN